LLRVRSFKLEVPKLGRIYCFEQSIPEELNYIFHTLPLRGMANYDNRVRNAKESKTQCPTMTGNKVLVFK
jgi:hypothetical protein